VLERLRNAPAPAALLDGLLEADRQDFSPGDGSLARESPIAPQIRRGFSARKRQWKIRTPLLDTCDESERSDVRRKGSAIAGVSGCERGVGVAHLPCKRTASKAGGVKAAGRVA